MLARIAHGLFWLGRDLARADHTARLLDGIYPRRAPGPLRRAVRRDALVGLAAGDHERRCSGWPHVDAGRPRRGGAPADRSTPTSRRRWWPASSAPVRGRAPARRHLHRDVGGAEHLRAGPRPPRPVGRPAHRALLRLPAGQAACALVWGLPTRTMLRDEGYAFLCAGGQIDSADMVLRILRVALPPGEEDADGERAPMRDGAGPRPAARRRRLPGLPARRRLPAGRGSGRAFPALRPRVSELRRVQRGGAARIAADRLTTTRAPRHRSCGSDGSSPTSSSVRGPGCPVVISSRPSGSSSTSWRSSTATSRTGTSPGPPPPSTCTSHELSRSATSPQYGYDGPVSDNLNSMRVKPATTSTQRVRRVHRARRPRGAADPPRGLLRHRGDRVRGAAPTRPPDDRRARPCGDLAAARPARGGPGTPSRLRAYREAGGEYLLATDSLPADGGLDELLASSRATHAAGHAAAAQRADSRSLRVPVGRHLRRVDDSGPARRRRRRLPGLRPPRPGAPAPPRHRGPLRLRATCSRVERTADRTRSRSTPTPGWRRSSRPPVAAVSRSGSASIRPTAGWRGRPTSRSDTVATTPTCPPIKGVFRGRPHAALEATVRMTRLDPATSARA